MSNGANAVHAPRHGFLRSLAAIGPGIVVAGSVIGSGELVNTPVQAARFGFVLLWAVLLSCVIKYFLQVEIARHCLVHNRTTFEALNQCPGPKIRGTSWIGLVYMLGYFLVTLPIIGIIGALAGLLGPLWQWTDSPQQSQQIWGALVVGLALVLLWQGLYRHLERLVAVLVGVFSLSVAVGLVLIQGTPYRISADEFLSGLTFSLGDDPAGAKFAVISLMGALGVAANELFMYPYWILEKGYHRELGDAPTENGDKCGDEQWTSRARFWINTIRLDAGLSTLLATIVTAAFFLLGCAVLFRAGIVPAGATVVDHISSVYTETYGPWSKWVFLVGAFCTLFSTLVVYVAASGRMWTDLFISLGCFARDNEPATRRSHQIVQAVWLVALLAAFLVMEATPARWIVLGHWVLGAFMTPLLMLCICWLAFHTDRRVRMGRWWAAALLTSVAIILYCVLMNLVV